MKLRNVYIMLCATTCAAFAANTPYQQRLLDAAASTPGVHYDLRWDTFSQVKPAQVPLLVENLKRLGAMPAAPVVVIPGTMLNSPYQQAAIEAARVTTEVRYDSTWNTFFNLRLPRIALLLENMKRLSVFVAPEVITQNKTPDELFSEKLGPTYLSLFPFTPDTRPSVYKAPSYACDPARFGKRINPYEISKSTGPSSDNDYWTDVGQVAYVPDSSEVAGIDRIQTFSYYSHAFAISPRLEASPDPSSIYWFNGVKVPLKRPVAAVRNMGMTTNEALVVYANGFIGVAGTQTSRGGRVPFDWPLPGVQLPVNKVPSAIALTTSNEFALVTVKDVTTGRGQLAVIALEGHSLEYHTFQWIGFPNQGSWSDMKLMGYIDLPFDNPDAVSASTNGLWKGPSATGNKTLGMLNILDPGTRWGMRQGEMGWSGVVATGGYALVSSKADGKAAFINLNPLMSWIKAQYLDDDKQAATMAKFNWVTMATDSGTRPVPRATEAFPGLLTAANTPTLITTLTLDRPTFTLAGQSIDRWSKDIQKAYISTESGVIRIYDTSSLVKRWSWEISGALREIGTVQVGANPVWMCFARFHQAGTPLLGTERADGLNNILHVACRGSRTIESVVTLKGVGQVYQRISDSRLQDPVCVGVGDRGNILTVCDYNGKQILNYRIGPFFDRVSTWGAVGQRFDPGAPGAPVAFECGGVMSLPGKPFWSGSNNLN